MTYDLLILGAGAAGLMAAIAAGEAASSPLKIAILEKNSRPGVKILVCGGGRCNLTNAGDQAFLIEQFGRNGRFLTPALQQFDNTALRGWFAGQDVPTHEEHDGKIYPDSNRAESVVTTLVRRVHDLGVEVFAGPAWAAARVERGDGGFVVTTVDGHTFDARNVLIAVGGQSYTRMGTTGDGYRFAAALGHRIVTLRPAIVGLLCQEEWPKALQGLAIQDVEVRIEVSGAGPLPKLTTGKPTPSINDLLFTHFGLSGPVVLNLSEIVAELLEKFPPAGASITPDSPPPTTAPVTVSLRVDFARHHTHDQLRRLFQSWQQRQGAKLVRKLLAQSSPEIIINATSPDQTWSSPPTTAHVAPGGSPGRAKSVDLGKPTPPLFLRASPGLPPGATFALPRRLAETMCTLSGIAPDQTCANLTAPQMHALVERLKASRFTITGTRGFKEAMVTAGGVALGEVDPRTMESKQVPGLFFAGEMLDLTGPSGGYNLQLAFSTGYLAGQTVARRKIHIDAPDSNA